MDMQEAYEIAPRAGRPLRAPGSHDPGWGKELMSGVLEKPRNRPQKTMSPGRIFAYKIFGGKDARGCLFSRGRYFEKISPRSIFDAGGGLRRSGVRGSGPGLTVPPFGRRLGGRNGRRRRAWALGRSSGTLVAGSRAWATLPGRQGSPGGRFVVLRWWWLWVGAGATVAPRAASPSL
jgi:hypothetical protein